MPLWPGPAKSTEGHDESEVPEPGTMVLMGAGVVLLLIGRRLRAKTQKV